MYIHTLTQSLVSLSLLRRASLVAGNRPDACKCLPPTRPRGQPLGVGAACRIASETASKAETARKRGGGNRQTAEPSCNQAATSGMYCSTAPPRSCGASHRTARVADQTARAPSILPVPGHREVASKTGEADEAARRRKRCPVPAAPQRHKPTGSLQPAHPRRSVLLSQLPRGSLGTAAEKRWNQLQRVSPLHRYVLQCRGWTGLDWTAPDCSAAT